MSPPRGFKKEAADESGLNALTGAIVDACLEVHRELGPGWKEDHYEEALCHELSLREIAWERQKVVRVHYKGLRLRRPHRLDIVVDGRVVVEVKAVDELIPLFRSQLVRYLKANGSGVGILVNFNGEKLAGNVRRVIVPLPDASVASVPSANSVPSRSDPQHRDQHQRQQQRD